MYPSIMDLFGSHHHSMHDRRNAHKLYGAGRRPKSQAHKDAKQLRQREARKAAQQRRRRNKGGQG